ncbi:TIGR02285 family protein [Roseibium sp.]|uniref:TIGR02285 family protein n=1 Tax=Roseibium sp. TaxID=1936156 RepID=UPI003B51D380
MMYRFVQLLILLALLSISKVAHSGDVVTWAKMDFPPVTITIGENAGQGYGDLTRKYFTDRLQEFDHQHLDISISRMVSLMETRDGVCDAAMFKTPDREKVMVFSDQVYWVQANRIIFLSKNRSRFDRHLTENETVDLETLAADKTLNGVVVRGRSYSPQIDAAVQRLAEQPHFTEVTDTIQMFKMLERERIDWVAGYAFEANFYFRKLGLSNDFLSFRAEGDAAVIPGYFACSDGPVGRSVVAGINQLITQAGHPPEYLQYYKGWLDDQALMDINKVIASMN